MGERIPVCSNVNISAWHKHLSDYFDQQYRDLIQFGFPLEFDRNLQLVSTFENYASARQYESHVDEYLREELQHGAILGLFDSPPFQTHFSPFMTRPKSNSAVRRTIIDLSWAKGSSVNDGVSKITYLGTDFQLHYPSVDLVFRTLNQLGAGAAIYLKRTLAMLIMKLSDTVRFIMNKMAIQGS